MSRLSLPSALPSALAPARLRHGLVGLSAAGLLGLTACGSEEPAGDAGSASEPAATSESSGPGTEAGGESGSGADVSVTLADPDGAEIGTVEMTEGADGVEVRAELTGMPPGGFHGFHVHETGLCEPDSPDPSDPSSTGDFLSAGGHLAEGDQEHSDHVGDMPSLIVDETGTATLSFVTDRYTLDDLADDDGAAVMVHAGPDNFGNVPERYAAQGPDDETLSTGDAGDRIACGVVGG